MIPSVGKGPVYLSHQTQLHRALRLPVHASSHSQQMRSSMHANDPSITHFQCEQSRIISFAAQPKYPISAAGSLNRTLPNWQKRETPSPNSSFTERQPLQKGEQRWQAAQHRNTALAQQCKMNESRARVLTETQAGVSELQRLQLVNQQLRSANAGYLRKLQTLERSAVDENSHRVGTSASPAVSIPRSWEIENTPPQNSNRVGFVYVESSVQETPQSRGTISHNAHNQLELSPFVLGQLPEMRDVQYISHASAQRQSWYIKMEREITGLNELLNDRNQQRARLQTLLKESKASEAVLQRKVLGLEALIDMVSERNAQQERKLSTRQLAARSLSRQKSSVARLHELEAYKSKFDELSEKSEQAYSQTRLLDERLSEYKETVDRLSSMLEEADAKILWKEEAAASERRSSRQSQLRMVSHLQSFADQLVLQHSDFTLELQNLLSQNYECKSQIEESKEAVCLQVGRPSELVRLNSRLKEGLIQLAAELGTIILSISHSSGAGQVGRDEQRLYLPEVLVTPEKALRRGVKAPLSTIREQLSSELNPSVQSSGRKQDIEDSPADLQQECEIRVASKTERQENFHQIENELNDWKNMYKVLRTSYLKLKEGQAERTAGDSHPEDFSEGSQSRPGLIHYQQESLGKQLEQLKFKYSLDMNHLKKERDLCLGQLAECAAELQKLRQKDSRLSQSSQQGHRHS